MKKHASVKCSEGKDLAKTAPWKIIWLFIRNDRNHRYIKLDQTTHYFFMTLATYIVQVRAYHFHALFKNSDSLIRTAKFCSEESEFSISALFNVMISRWRCCSLQCLAPVMCMLFEQNMRRSGFHNLITDFGFAVRVLAFCVINGACVWKKSRFYVHGWQLRLSYSEITFFYFRRKKQSQDTIWCRCPECFYCHTARLPIPLLFSTTLSCEIAT